jgi:hypothetical protein
MAARKKKTPPPAPAPQVQRNQPPPNAPRFVGPVDDDDVETREVE